MLFAIFLPELKEAPFFLFLAGAILASILEFTTGALLEKLFHRKWWDYSDIKWNYEGYVCLPVSLIWGGCAVILNMFLNPLLVKLLGIMPKLLIVIIMIALTVVLVLDTVGTTLAIRGLQKKQVQLAEFTEGQPGIKASGKCYYQTDTEAYGQGISDAGNTEDQETEENEGKGNCIC